MMKKSWSLFSLLFVAIFATSCGSKKIINGGNINNDNGDNNNHGGLNNDLVVSKKDLFASEEVIKHATRDTQGSLKDYYEPVRGLKGEALKNKLNQICAIDPRYVESYDDLRYSFEYTEVDPDNPDYLVLMYTGEKFKKSDFCNSFSGYVNREHVWPNSKGVGKEGKGADKHMQRICEKNINNDRGNRGFGYVTTGDIKEYSGINEGNKRNESLFEPKDEFKGDCARIIFYMATVYDTLELAQPTDKTRFNYWSGEFTHGKFDDLYKWATDPTIDPVSKFEMNKNNVVDIKYQHNRNPFIDHPEFIEMIYDKNYAGPGALK